MSRPAPLALSSTKGAKGDHAFRIGVHRHHRLEGQVAGASVAGVADIGPMKESPSHLIAPNIGMDPTVGAGSTCLRRSSPPRSPGRPMRSPPSSLGSSTLLVGRSPTVRRQRGRPGIRILIRIVKAPNGSRNTDASTPTTRPTSSRRWGLPERTRPCSPASGCIGKNNIVVTPEYGRRIRRRALLLDRTAKPTGLLDSDPCAAARSPAARPVPWGPSTAPCLLVLLLGSRFCPASTGRMTGSPATPRCRCTSRKPPGRWRLAMKKARIRPRR